MPRKVLVADDSVTIQKVVGITFASEDVTLSFVDNGEEAIEMARQIKPDLIIADVLMPRKTGYDVCEAIKHDPELSHVPVLLLTGTFEPFDAERSRRVGADGTITKPFESRALIRQVNELLDRAASGAPAAAPAVVPAAVPVEAPAVPSAPPQDLAPAPALNEAESAFADLSRDLALEPLPASPSEPTSSTPSSADPSPAPEPAVDEAFDFGFESGGDFSFAGDTGDAVQAPPSAPPAEAARLSEREDEFEFVEEGGEVLELGEPAVTTRLEEVRPSGLDRPYGAGDPPADEVRTGARATDAGDVWDLSDLEAVEESALAEPAEPAEEAESPSFWDDAAAEAIDLVESVSVDAPEELLLSDQEPLDGELSAAEEPPLEAAEAIVQEPLASGDGADLDLPLMGIDEETVSAAEALQPAGEPLHPSLEELPEFDFDAPGTGEPPEAIDDAEPPVEPLAPVPLLVEPFYAEAPEQPAEAVPAQAPAEAISGQAPAVPVADDAPTTIASVAQLGDERVNDVVRRAVNDAVERVTWEAFSDLSETVVKAVKEKVEQIAWEVIPQMAEAMIKEEIKRISDEKK